MKALWLNDAGAVRGAGLFARSHAAECRIVSAADDLNWFAVAAKAYGVALQRGIETEAGLALIGPKAPRVLRLAGLDPTLSPLAFIDANWDGVHVMLSRFGEHGGFEIWSSREAAPIVWDRVREAGAGQLLVTAGAHALDTLDVEAGVARPWRDYVPARDVQSSVPTPRSLSLESLVDPGHRSFNGYAGWRAARIGASSRIYGLLIDAEEPAAFAPLYAGSRYVGLSLTSRYSPALKAAIALAQIEEDSAGSGTQLLLGASLSPWRRKLELVSATVVDLPFLPVPDSIEA